MRRTLPDSRSLDTLERKTDTLTGLGMQYVDSLALYRLDGGQGERSERVRPYQDGVSDGDGSDKGGHISVVSSGSEGVDRTHPDSITPDTTVPTNGTLNTSETENSRSSSTGYLPSKPVGTMLRKVLRRGRPSPDTFETRNIGQALQATN
jgi:hypothetical protein